MEPEVQIQYNYNGGWRLNTTYDYDAQVVTKTADATTTHDYDAI